MTRYAKKNDIQKKRPYANVIPFPQLPTSSTMEPNVESILTDAIGKTEDEKKLKAIIDAAVFDACLRIKLLNIERPDDPFDAVYISELRADKIISGDINQIKKYIDIIDLSNTIIFQDEWED